MNDAIVSKVAEYIGVPNDEAQIIVNKAVSGKETTEVALDDWFENRFKPNVVFIDEDGYASMCIDALKIVSTTAATDYGSTRQRDFGQVWADTTRGYLGELALKLFLSKKFAIDIELGHERGDLTEYLPTDIHKIRTNGVIRDPKIRIGIKASKWNGIWLDLPGDQFSHSHAHIFVKVGTGRDHLFAYLKKISVFKDKVLKVGKDMGSLTEIEANNLYDILPTFRPIPAYICGFVLTDSRYTTLDYSGKKGRKNYTIGTWNGPILPGDVEKVKEKEGVLGKVSFEGIGEFSHDKGHLFNTGNLLWRIEEWEKLLNRL